MTYRPIASKIACGSALIALACTENGVNIGNNTAGSGGAAGSGAAPSYGGGPERGGAAYGGGSTRAGSGGEAGEERGGAPGSGGTTSAGGAPEPGGQGGGPSRECACPAERVSWSEALLGGWNADAGLRSILDCDGFHRRNEGGATVDPIPYECDVALDRCDPEWKPELDAVLALLDSAPVRRALAMAPILFGVDVRPVDGSVFRIVVGESAIEIGRECAPDEDCIPTPPEVQALADALQRLTRHAAVECSPECLPTLPNAHLGSPPTKPCNEPRYYWTYGRCELLSAPDCNLGAGYETEDACQQAHFQCADLFTKECGGGSGGVCDEDEYCGYRGEHSCGDGDPDGVAVCLPKPRACNDVVELSCGCDGVTYQNLCQAARAGTGVFKFDDCTED